MEPDMTAPVATYRLQLHPGFGFDAAAATVPYLSRLGVSHVYTSPVLQAEAGSSHGYDVVDHGQLNAELGGAAGFARLVDALRAAGMGLVVDVVPNHMAVGPANAWWWDVLQHGRASPYARFFDVDWDPPESRLRDVILLPVLPDHYGRVLEAGGIRLERAGPEVRVATGEQRFPLDPASLQPLLADAAERSTSDELAFIARSLGELPPSTSTAADDLARRQRDAAVLGERLTELAARPRLAEALDAAIAAVNADPDRLDALLEAQNYRLAFWRASSRDLGYRRFFDIDSLVGLRVEDPAVFSATHRIILERVAAGEIDGLRIDHPDGLRDPAGYFARLRAEAPGTWIVAEKILEGDEQLPDWPIDGSTGYRFANLATGLLVDADAEPAMTDLYRVHADADVDWDRVAAASRQLALREQLGSDLNRLTDLWLSICEANRRYRDFTRHDLHEALAEMAAAFAVYRTYVRADEGVVSDEDRRVVEAAAALARERRPDLDPDLFAFLSAILRLEVEGRLPAELAMRFQQLTPAAMAKGIEDTAFYRYLRLVALNEVGGDPGRFGVGVGAFHAAMAHDQERWPAAMLTTSTHDTKRSGDVRARLAVISEIPERWGAAVERLARRADPHRASTTLPDAKAAYLFFQTLVGAWPIDAERCVAYLAKATREAKERTSWTSPDSAYDEALSAMVRGCLADPAFVAEVERIAAELTLPGRIGSLAQTLWKLTAPGVPDLYQGTELWDLSLVDPDNRRPVDFDVRSRLLDEVAGMSAGEAMERADDGLPKLLLVQRALDLRRRRPGELGPRGGYHPLAAVGPAADHAVAYRRGEGVIAVAPRLTVRLQAAGGWRGTLLPISAGTWRNTLDGREMGGGELALAELLDPFPVALLERLA
jgi:(1->4)-alpha-D-glucan 1-alpha-D-glucosylmutase